MEYVVLFNALSDMIKKLGDIQLQLMFYQQIAEDMYINGEPGKIEPLSKRPPITLLTTGT
ncbi:MAG: hypothetical protein ACYCX2_04025 [Christensenellales bacterium]